MAPKPPKLRPRPERTEKPHASQPAKPKIIKPTDAQPAKTVYRPSPNVAHIGGVEAPVHHAPRPQHHQGNSGHNRPVHRPEHRETPAQPAFVSPEPGLRNPPIRSRGKRMPMFIKRNPISEKKFVPQEGAMTGHEAPGHSTGLKRDTVYWVPVGGLEEVGRNCSFFEYNDEIVIIDMGIQFPEEETPGIDWIIPNTNYLEKKKKNIKGLIITHAHYDHFGAVPYVLEKLGNPTIYATALIKALLEKRMAEIPNAPKMNFHVIKNHDRVKLSEHFTVEFFGVAHTVPDTTGVLVETPAGNMVHFADFRLDYDADDFTFNLKEFEWVKSKGAHSLLIDSTNACEEGHSVSERVVEANLQKLMTGAEGRIILSTFASMITRLAEVVKVAEEMGRKVVVNGRSMKDNLELARQLGYFKFKSGTLIPVEEMHNYKDNKLVILSTGAMGQENAGLMRIVSGEHKFIKVKPGDTIIFSSSVIPGNERAVQTLKDNFARQGAIVHTNEDLDIHSSGHAPGPDLAIVIKTCEPKFVIPVHGFYFMRAANIQNAKTVGFPKERVILADNGQVLEMTAETAKITDKQIDSYYVMVDGLGVGDVEAVVVRDRKLLAQEGMIVVILTIDRKNGRLIKNPDIISRGFIYLKDHGPLMDDMRGKIRSVMHQTAASKQAPEPDYIKGLIRDQIGLFIYTKTQRRPMILPVLIEV